MLYFYYVLGVARISERAVPFHLRKIKLIVPIQLECTVTIHLGLVNFSSIRFTRVISYPLVHFKNNLISKVVGFCKNIDDNTLPDALQLPYHVPLVSHFSFLSVDRPNPSNPPGLCY